MRIGDTADYGTAWPFPHAILDGMVPDAMLRAAVNEWPHADHPLWYTFTGEHEYGKRQMENPDWAGATAAANVLRYLCSHVFTAAVERLTGIADLTPRLLGGGLHESPPGAYLDVHTDFSHHEDGTRRCVNLLLFVNDDWHADYGGALVLGDPADEAIIVGPTWNRLVVFTTTSSSWHGHPEPWQGPSPRRSFAVYYYGLRARPVRPQGTTWLEHAAR